MSRERDIRRLRKAGVRDSMIAEILARDAKLRGQDPQRVHEALKSETFDEGNVPRAQPRIPPRRTPLTAMLVVGAAMLVVAAILFAAFLLGLVR